MMLRWKSNTGENLSWRCRLLCKGSKAKTRISILPSLLRLCIFRARTFQTRKANSCIRVERTLCSSSCAKRKCVGLADCLREMMRAALPAVLELRGLDMLLLTVGMVLARHRLYGTKRESLPPKAATKARARAELTHGDAKHRK